jgi:coenzyme F420-reducing hydrogenase delta subunit
MLPRKVAAVVMAAATAVEGIFVVVAMVVGILAVMVAGISAAVCISAVGATLGADRLRGRIFAAIVPSLSIMPDRLPYGR